MTFPAHLDGVIDLLVDALVRDLTNEKPPAPGQASPGVVERNDGILHNTSGPANTAAPLP
jgi:hypothetical protein